MRWAILSIAIGQNVTYVINKLSRKEKQYHLNNLNTINPKHAIELYYSTPVIISCKPIKS